MQGSENHTDLYNSLQKWKNERKIQPKTSLTISIGEPQGGPNDQQNFLADPFRVSFTTFLRLYCTAFFDIFHLVIEFLKVY